jgi:N-glycosylase/DNA lyase
LKQLRGRPYKEIFDELLNFVGVGRKVADCVALFSLDKYDVVPIDTHVYQIAQRFMPSLSTLQNGSKTLSLSVYQSIGEFFRQSFGYFLSQHKKQTTNKNKNKNELYVVEKRHSYIEMVI